MLEFLQFAANIKSLANLGNICAVGNQTPSKALVLSFYVDVVSSFRVKSENINFYLAVKSSVWVGCVC